MIRALLLALTVVLNAGAAAAGLSQRELAEVSVVLPASAHIDLDLTAHDAFGRALTIRQILDGHPALVTFADFTCTSLCGSDLRLLSTALESAGVPPGDYRVVVIGIDPKDTPESAEAMAGAEMSSAIQANTILLLPDAPTVHRLTAALGFHYAYDPAIDQFAHPAAVYIVGTDGAVRAVLSPFALDVTELKAALFSTHAGAAPSLLERIRILCYALDPATGIHTLRIITLLKLGAAVTVVLVAGGILLLARRASS